MNLISTLVENGFIVSYFEKSNNKLITSGGFLDVVNVYHPDCTFKKHDKTVIISYNGLIGYLAAHRFNLQINEDLLKSQSTVIILLIHNENVMYYSDSGRLPTKEVLNAFLN